MTATRRDIAGWIKTAQQRKATHLIVACDTFDHENYPVYVSKDEDIKVKIKQYSINMQMIDEIYSFTGKYNIESQLAELRAWHTD